MTVERRTRARTIVATGLLLALVTIGCGRRAEGATTDLGDAATAQSAAAQAAATTAAPMVSPTAVVSFTQRTSSAPSPDPTPSLNPNPTGAPLTVPDLTPIQLLIDQIDAALGADATADTEEGNPQ